MKLRARVGGFGRCLVALPVALALSMPVAAQSLRPEPGLWYNPDRSGHGVDFEFAGDTLIGIWYTYDVVGQPTWYIAIGPYTGTTWNAPLLSARWNGSAATLTTVGTLGLTVREDDRADLSWNLNGNTGSEAFERLRYGAGVPVSNLTGIYHNATQTGWGLSFEGQGSTAAAVLYFYDSTGFPRWVLGTGPVTSAGADKAGARDIPMSAFNAGFASNAPYVAPPRPTPAGTLTLDNGLLDIDVILPGGLGEWRRSVTGTLLTDTGPAYLFAHVEGPAIIAVGSSVPYSARFDTNLRNLDGLQYAWTVLYGDRVVQATTPTIVVQPVGGEGLINIQVEATHPASGRSAFVTRNVSAQIADLFDVAIVPAFPGMLAGRDNRFDAVVIGGRSPYAYEWTGDRLSDVVGPTTRVIPDCDSIGTSELRVSARDADGRVATARLPFTYGAGQCALTIEGPACLAGIASHEFVASVGGEPLPYFGSYAWTSEPTGQLFSCSGTRCRVFGASGSPDQFLTLRVENPLVGAAERRLAQACPEGPQLAIQANPPALPPLGRYVDLVFTVTSGLPPYSISLNCVGGDEESEPTGGGAVQTGECDFMPELAGVQVARASVTDAAGRSQQAQIVIPVEDAPALQATLTSPSPASTCVPLNFGIAIGNGVAPFDVTLDFGDGSAPFRERTSMRSLNPTHAFAPVGGGSARQLQLTVVDADGARVEIARSLTPANVAMEAQVVLRNGGGQNIHIYDLAASPLIWFDISTRLTPGAERTELVTIPADACETRVDYGAGRNVTQLAQAACTFRKGQSNSGVTYTESSGPLLTCD